MKKNCKRKKLSLVIFVIIFLWILFFPYQKETYKDGWTKLYSALIYQYIKFNTLEWCKESKLFFGQTKRNYKFFENMLCKKEDNFSKNIKTASYSNLVDKKTQDFVKKSLWKYNIPEENIENFFYYVDFFNDAVEKEWLLEKWFEPIDIETEKEYPYYWEKLKSKNLDLTWTNCRINSFLLFKDSVNIENLKDTASQILNFDDYTITHSPKAIFSENDKQKFYTFFSEIPTPLVKDKEMHIKNIKSYWKKHNISFKNQDGFSVISMFFHDDLDNILFIGHIGILLEVEDKFIFLEKLTFDSPYQAIIFEKKSQIYDYLMNKYGSRSSADTAKPFIMENDKEFEYLN